jgi:hypothetical protein
LGAKIFALRATEKESSPIGSPQRDDLGSARASRAGDGALAIANFPF